MRGRRRGGTTRFAAVVGLATLSATGWVDGLAFQEPALPSDGSATLVIRVVGMESQEGSVAIAVFGSRASYEAMEGAVAATFEPIGPGPLTEWTVEGLPPGDYVISVYHDRNDNQELDTSFMGMPQERYGFSNDARGRFGPPGFDDAHFSLGPGRAEIEVRVR